MNINKVSQSIESQSPDFIGSEYPLFNKFLEYYYKSQEKTGLGQNILNNFLQYLDIDKLDISILDGATTLVEAITDSSDKIVVESINPFLETNGSILIGDEVIYYEGVDKSPEISLSPGISYEQVKLKWTTLASLIDSFDGTTTAFAITSQDSPIAPPSAQHLVVSLYGNILVPNIDYTVSGSSIVFTTAPRTKIPADDAGSTYIFYLSGFVENTIYGLDNLSGAFGDGKKQFSLTRNGVKYEPEVEEYLNVIYDNRLLVPKVDYFIDEDQFVFKVAPLNGRFLSIHSIEAPIPSFGTGAIGFSRINNTGNLTSVSSSAIGTGYRFEYPPQVSIDSEQGSGAAATALVNGLKSITLLEGGRGYSATNPPVVQVQSPTKNGSSQATINATVTDGAVTALTITNSGSGYTFTPRITFVQPGGAKLGTPTITSEQVTTIPITDGGFGYTTAPTVYIDEPTGSNPIKAALRANLTEGKVTSISILNAGQGYTTVPRVAIVDPVGAQVLQTVVDGDGRVIRIELLNGGGGYNDVPSVYIVDNRTNGGTGATAVASIFNGQITDLNITNFGSGYSAATPPDIIIQAPPQAKASVEIGLNEVTGFVVTESGKGYSKAAFTGCARAASGITKYTETGNAVFSNNTVAASAAVGAGVKCLDALFVKRLLDKYTEQFLPDVPELDYSKIDVRTSIKTIKDFYSSKGTSFSIAYLFKLLYGETVTVTYPKDQIIKPSAATWSIDTILRATLVSGSAENIRDGLLTQEADIADPNVTNASALVENYISIKTSDVEIFELVLSEETIVGTFTVPYKTKLAEPLNQTDSIITVDSTIGWPERNGEFVIGGGTTTELVQYKEKSLNQFIECTRSANGIVEDWDSATQVASNFTVYVNRGTTQEVVLNVVGIVDAQQTVLTDTGSYYLPGDKLAVSKLGGTSIDPHLTTWLYNVKKLINVSTVVFGGVNNRFATITCSNNHGLLVGDQVTVYGANPIIYNGTFLVTSRDSATVFQYQLPQPATVVPQGNILVSVDLNKGKSTSTAVLNAIGPYTTNVQNSFFNTTYAYLASTGIPNYNIGPFPGSALLPGNQRKLNRFPITSTTISTKNTVSPGPIGTWVNGVSIWSYKSTLKKTFGAVTSVAITNAGKEYDAASPPVLTISGGGGTGATAAVIVNGSVNEITVSAGGSGFTSSPLVSIVGGGGSGASATAIITKGVVSRILINSGGTGYTSQPSITVVGGGGTGAAATASVRGPIQSVSVGSGGISYTSTPTVSLSSGSGAVAQAIVQNGRIISIAIISAGSGYTTAPEITIQGQGFGAVARASIDTDGENAGRVTSITIVNRGIGYLQGTTVINLNSVGSEATFTANVFEWTYNLQSTTTFDSAKGSVFEGFNNQYGGEYAHLSNPQTLRYILGDNLFENTSGVIKEKEDGLLHSPIIGWAFDGNPIYGPYGYSDPTDQSSAIQKLNTSYRLKTNLVYNIDSNPNPVRAAGPLLSAEVAGKFVEDYEYVFGLGALDQYNGRFCKTPEYPEGRYSYFVTIDATDDGNPLFPYVMGPSFNSVVDSWNLNDSAVQQNIPTGVVRYRDPYENVDIDVERAPNASTNALTLENGDVLLFDIEDEDRSGVIEADETADPDQVFEESPLQLFDYFPKVKFDSKVDIEVETTTKFEDASVTGFTVENPGISYQVNDRLIFDNTDTDGSGVSARISRIKGEAVEAYTFENVSGNNFGVLTSVNPHNLQPGDSVFIDYTPVMDSTNKTFVVRQFKGIEEIVVNQTGSGYNTDIPPTIIIDGNGTGGKLEAVVTSVGSIENVNIINSGYGYTSNPRVILSHPQVFKKADYYVAKFTNRNYVRISDVYINDSKETYICGKTYDASSNDVAFIAKLSATGVKEWEASLELPGGQQDSEFLKLYVDGKSIWVVGQNSPNSAILSSYNPDVILCKYTEAANGLSAALTFQKGYAGISGSTRGDFITAIKKYSDTRFIIGGYTNTNSGAPYDAFIASIDTSGNFAIKRKIASSNKSEKITDIVIDGTDVYASLELAATQSNADIDTGVAKIAFGVNTISVTWIKQFANSLYSIMDTSLAIDEFKELYVTGGLRLKSDDTTRDSFWVGKIDANGTFIWNYRYLAPTGGSIIVTPSSAIDIFGDLNIAFTSTNNTNTLPTVDTVKIGYDGKIKNHTTNQFTQNNTEGITAYSVDVDNSGDINVVGQTQWNRNEFIFPFTSGATTDTTSHYTLTSTSTSNSITYANDVAKIHGYQTGATTWTQGNLQITSAQLGARLNSDFTIEMMVYKDTNTSSLTGGSITQHTLLAIGDAEEATGALWLYYDVSSGYLELKVTNSTTKLNSAGGAGQSSLNNMFADNTWQFIGLKKEGNVFTVYVNGIQAIQSTVPTTALGSKHLYVGQIPGRSGSAGNFRINEQGQFHVDNFRLRNRAITPTVPSDVSAFPTAGGFGLQYTWTNTAWFTTNLNRYDLIDYDGFSLKIDKNADAARIGTVSTQTNTQLGFTRTAVTPVTGSTLTMQNTGYALSEAGFQSLDFDDATINMTPATETLTYTQDVWSSRTATVPSPGSQKLNVSAVVRDRYFFKVTPTTKIDNIQELTINQAFRFTVGSKLRLNNAAGTFVNSGYIVRVDNTNNKVYLAVNNNTWTDDTATGNLVTEQFSEQSTYGIVGPIPNDINVIEGYTFPLVVNTTPGTFDIDLDKYNLDGTYNAAGSQNLDSFAKFKPFATIDYSVRIDEVGGSSPFIVGSVVQLTSSDISFNAAYSTTQITNLTGVTKITLVANLDKILQVSSVANSDEVYVITSTSHYLSAGDVLYVDGNPSQTVGSVVYDEYDGAFPVDRVISPLEFTYKLNQAAVTSPATSAGSVNIFMKSPTLKMYYGHQYIFDLSHSSLVGGNLSFAKDSLYKLEYSFNSIERVGTPGVTGAGAPTPSVKLKVDETIVTNISYYFDPSRTGSDSPVVPGSYLDVVDSPYKGNFEISSVAGQTITRGADIIKFPLLNEPEGAADINQASYATSSLRAVGSINAVRIVNPGGFYTRLPIVTSIQSTRQIERIQINDPGTEYAVGQYTSVPITGDGEGGFVTISVADGQDANGVTIPGQIQLVTVTSPGKGYTTATIDIESVSGILGSGLTGSGAEVVVVIPPFGSGASIFTQGSSVGKIKKLKNNNFGYDYPHDYTLRPEITFPINAQLTSTSILDSITVTDPGTGYSQAPAVVITGGGGSGAIAEATTKNGRLDTIIVKDPGAGYSSTPIVSLRSSFNYVVNLDLGLLQFAFPHGIANGSAVTLNVVDTGDGVAYPLSAGATGRLNGTTTYYAIAGTANSLENDQLKLAITSANASLGDALAYVNAGTGRQQVLTESFGGAATANVITSTFLEGELVYQGESLSTSTATGYVSTNAGWQVGPRVLKIVDYTGEFSTGQRITGVISKSSGIMTDIKVAKGVLEIGSVTKTTGQFIDDVGKPSEIIQKIQDSYYYQDFSYAVKSAVSIGEWKEILIKNVHPASFKVFGELDLNDYGFIPNKETFFQLTKSVELARDAIVPNIQNFALVEPVYSEFNNTEVLFRQKRLTSSENILTSVVQRLDDISSQFDGQKISFPLTVDGNNVVANANQLMIVLNGVVQTPGTAFEIQGDSVVFAEPPQPPASVKYVNVQIESIATVAVTFTNISGIFPTAGMALVGTSSQARLTVTTVVGNTINGFITQGTYTIGELVTVGATGFAANVAAVTSISNIGLFVFGESITNLTGDTAKVEQINLASGAETPLAQLRYTIGAATTSIEMVAYKTDNTGTDYQVTAGTFVATKNYQLGSEIFRVDSITQNANSTSLVITRGQNGTQAVSHQEDAPVYSTDISITNALTLSKIAGTYQSTPGLFDIQLNDIILGAQSGVVARVTQTSTYQDPTTLEFIGQVNISEGSSFFGLLFNRITSQTYPNVVLDDISKSQIGIVDFTDNSTAFDSSFPANEQINNYIIPYDNLTGTFQENEYIRNYKIEYGNNQGEFLPTESAKIRKLTFTDRIGSGFFQAGQIIRSRDTKAEVIGANSARSTIFLGKVGRSQRGGLDYNIPTWEGEAQIDTSTKKFGTASLLLGRANHTHTFVSGVANAIQASNGATSTHTAVAGTTYDPEAGTLVINIGTHSLTTSNKVTIADNGLTFTCTADSNTTNHPYPRSTDPASGQALTISAVTSTSITVDVGVAQVSLDYLSVDSSSDFAWGTAGFTVELYIKAAASSISGIHSILDFRTASTDAAGHLYLNAGQVRYNVSNSDIVTSGATTIAQDTWTHIAVQRTSTTTKIFINGAEAGTGTDSTNYAAKPFVLGASYALGNAFYGHIDELRLSATTRYSSIPFTPVNGIFQGDTNTKILWHFDGADKQVFLEDWSGTQDFTINEYINNDAIRATARLIGGVHKFVSASSNAVTVTGSSSFTPTVVDYDAITGSMEITIGSHSYTTSDTITIAANSLTFTCSKDNHASQHTYPRLTDPSYGATLAITAVTGTTITVNVGVASRGFNKKTHRYINASDNLILNKDFIAQEAVYIMKARYPFFTVLGGEVNCEDDVKDIVSAMIEDFRNGSNSHIWDAAALYVNRTTNPITLLHVSDDLKESLYVLETVGKLLKYVITNTPWSVQGDHGFTQKYDTTITESDYLSQSVTQVTPSGATYNPSTGDMVITSSGHNLVSDSNITASGATYDATTGVLVITSNGHNLENGDGIQLADNSLTFTCTMDGNATNHTYPRPNDPAAQGWLEVSNKTTNTFEVNVGKSPIVNYQPTTGTTYDPATGLLKMFIGDHNLAVGTKIKLTTDSLSFTCTTDGNTAVKTYPRASGTGANAGTPDPAYNTSVAITADGVSSTATGATYAPATGVMVITQNAHGFVVGDKIRIADNSLGFTCTKDGNHETKTYPRSTDPFSGRWLRISAKTDNTFTVNVGPSSAADQYAHTFVSASANGIIKKDNSITVDVGTSSDTTAHTFVSALSNAVVTGGNYTHSFVSATTNGITKAGDAVFLADGAISFTCSKDGNQKITAYPRSTDPASKQVLKISAHTTNTFTINVGASSADDQYTHTFSSAVSNGITKSEYSLTDCTDVITTADNLLDIITDTLTYASAASPVDYLATVTKSTPAYEFVGGTVNAFTEVPFIVDYHNGATDQIYTNQIDEDARGRFRDASNLIRANRKVIVDKAAFDMLTRYPDLALSMPRNANGTSTDGTLRCKTDLGLILDGLTDDIYDGGNLETITAARFYIGTSGELQHIRLQVWQSVYAHERLGFYAKQAITGDLDYTNTDGIIVGDWGITNDAGGCANVKTAIDTLVTTINDIIAPTGADFEVAADRLYFNRNFIAEEITGLITTEFTYLLNNVQYQAFTYPNGALGESKCQRDLKLIIESAISDLQTGGNNSTIDAISKYLTAALTLNIVAGVEQELLATVYGIEQLSSLGEKAIDNLLYANGEDTGGTAGAYSALHTDDAAVRDSLSLSSAVSVKNRWKELIEIAINILAPAKQIGRSAAKHVLYNRNYFLQEIQTQTVAQFGAGSWTYDDFVNTTVNDIVHDLITTDTKKKTTAYNITIQSVSSTAFQVGEVVRSNIGGYATVLEYDSDTNFFVVGPFTGTAWVATNTLTGKTSGATATISSSGVGSPYDWYTEVANIRTLASARLITSNISGQIAGTNLWTNPEAYGINWTPTTNVTITDNQGLAPDDTQTAEDVTPNNGQNGQHEINRDYNLTAFETFDSGTVTFDTTNESFDTGSPGTSATQQFTFSGFVKQSGSQSIRFQLQLDPGGAGEQNAFFDLNLTNGTTGTVFTPQGGITADAFGAIPLGNGWYRCYITCTFSFGFNTLRSKFIIKSAAGATVWTGDASTGILVWGAKLTKGALDPYQAQSGKTFFSDTEFNTKNYILELMQQYMIATLDNSLTSPSTAAGFYSFYSSADAANYTKASVSAMLRTNLRIITNQLSNDTSYIGLTTYNGITIPTKAYGNAVVPVGVNGGLNPADFVYGLLSNAYCEVESITLNEGLVAQVYSRFRIDGDITDGPYTMNEVVAKQGAPSITGVVYGFHEDANFKYLDVKITAGPWAITDNIVGATNSTTAQISALETRVHIIDLKGDFVADIPFKGYTSGAIAQPTSFLKTEAAITDNTGGTLTVDTASLLGNFETTAVVYPSSSRQYVTVSKYAGLDIGVGDRIASVGYKRFGINVISGLNNFTVGNRLYKVVSGVQDSATYGIITDVDIANNYVYMIEYQGTFTQGDQIGDYGLAATFPVGYASISTIVTTAGAGAALVQDVRPDGVNKRLYLSDVTGTFGVRDAIKGPDSYGSVIVTQVDLKARVKRSFKGFDGTQTTFNLSQNNGTSYLPDPAGHLLVFVNGILQPPGATNAYTAFSNQIQFTEAPDLGASFTGFYIGKLRQLDDISFEFDSLRQSFNLKRNDVFYSLTLTDGVQSSVIRPENNIICSLNGVIQEPGVGFEIVGSRIIFSEIPRFGSTFVAFSYVGSEADVDAAEVVPPIEPGDFIDIQGETADREVAVIESSNSLITFDYLGSVFGQNASATAVLTQGFIDTVQVTGGGSGYTSRPTVRIDSISGFDGNIRALVGVAGVELSATGSGYQNPSISVDTVVPDDYVAPDLSTYGEELVDPETP